MKKLISALALAAVLLSSLTACGQKNITETQANSNAETTSATERTTEETTTQTTTALTTTKKVVPTEPTAKKPDSNRKYYAPNNYRVDGNADSFKIEWHDDNSLRILGFHGGNYDSYYDIKLNEYGEVLSIKQKNITEDENGKKIEEQSDYWLTPEYDANHRLISVTDKDPETNTVYSKSNYFYNNEGQRIKNTISGTEETRDTLFEYKNGQLVKSTHKGFEPTGQDRIYKYKYDTNKDGRITNSYCNILIPGVLEDDSWEKEQSFTYEKVNKAQYDFFYNTLIYHIIDSNEGIL